MGGVAVLAGPDQAGGAVERAEAAVGLWDQFVVLGEQRHGVGDGEEVRLGEHLGAG